MTALLSEQGLRPFTLDHFRDWASRLILDNEQPWELEPFQEAFLADVFAGKTACWLIVPEGNGKTTLVAGLALYHIQHRMSAACPVAASSRDQAKILYTQASGFVFRSELSNVFTCQEGNRRILCGSMGSEIKIHAADAGTADGVIPTLAIIDELHRHKDLALYRTWLGKMPKREGQLVVISTAGEPGSEFETTRESIRQRAPEVTRERAFVRAAAPQAVLHDWAVPERGDPNDLDLVAAANPSERVTPETLREKRNLPGMTEAHWRRFTCNLATRGNNAAVQEAEWDGARVRAGRDEWLEIPAGEPRWAGLDLAWKWDTTALVPLWTPRPDFRLFGRPTIPTPPRDGTSLDPGLVEQALLDEHERGPIHTIVMDTNKGEQLASWIQDELGATVIDRSQTNSFACMDYERFMEALRKGWLRHTGDPELTLHVLNAVAKQLPGGDFRFDRPHASRLGSRGQQDGRVIDGLTAASMVHTTAAAELDVDDDDLGAMIFDPWGEA